VEDVILEAVKKFNNNLGAGLTPNPDLYELYVAKGGRRDSGLPSLEKGQSIEKVGRGKFFLVCLQKDNRLESVHSLQSLKSVGMEFDKKIKKP
jgi:cold shock CspA family protein